MPTVTFRTTICNDCNKEFVSTICHPRLSASCLRSRTIPTDLELAQTISFIRDEEHEVQRYEQELARLRETVQKLESEATFLKQCIQERRQWTSAVRRIPSEIWRYIFELACDTASFTSEQSAKCQMASAFDFSRVSSYWRSIVNAFPRLWSSLEVDVYQLTRGSKCLIQLYLRNAGEHPLRIRILAKPGFDSEESSLKTYLGRDGYSTLRMLLKTLSRCSEVTFDIDDAILSAALHRMEGKISFSQLQALTLFRCTFWKVLASTSESISPLWEHLSQATRLRKISLDSELLINAGVLPYHQLTSVEVDMADICNILLLLESCPHLLSLLWTSLTDNAIPLVNVPVMAPCLRELSIFGIPLPELDTFFSSIILPSLTVIELCPLYRSMYHPDVYGNGHWGGEESLANMLERSDAPMKRLSLDCQDWYLTLGGLDTILQACWRLTSLEIFVSCDEQTTPNGFILEFLSRFSAPRDHDNQLPIVPQLTHLRLHEVLQSDTEVSLQALEVIIRMAENRAQAMALKHVDISFSTELICRELDKASDPVKLEQDVHDRAQKLWKDGIQLSISWINRGPIPSPEPWYEDGSESDSDSCSSDMEG
ncbi:hypothetical protein Moror_12677 [Moniliophthora roreri MCA 2997]|uniref:F-box domain-containing protein n=1 Tax=Moniliophthora roreri (strain MCA 2997) TaxID=1381753 RepID=V2XRJ9_MONRO|nr:hypothetical protein Moror_12677 [Moniliophthora roreri MCA 2997]